MVVGTVTLTVLVAVSLGTSENSVIQKVSIIIIIIISHLVNYELVTVNLSLLCYILKTFCPHFTLIIDI